jgi:hypothetical protein
MAKAESPLVITLLEPLIAPGWLDGRQPRAEGPRVIVLSEPLRVLTSQQITQIDRCLANVEEFGRVTFIKQEGKLRFIEKTESVEATSPDRKA